MDFKPVGEYKTVQAYVTDNIRWAIIQGVFHPGQKLNQDDIARKFNSSRVPVREALRTLEAEGLVKFFPNRGAVVAQLCAEELEEIYSIRAILECMAGRLAAARIMDEQLARVCEIIEEMDRCREERDRWLKLNNLFHLEIYRAAGRPRLLGFITELRNVTEPYVRRYIESSSDLRAASEEHARILDALKDKDVDRIEQEIRGHLSHVCRRILKLLKDSSVPSD